MAHSPRDFDVEIGKVNTHKQTPDWMVSVHTPDESRCIATCAYEKDAQLIKDALVVLNHVTPGIIIAWDGD